MGAAEPDNIVEGVTFSMVGVKQPDYPHVLVSEKTPEGRKMREEMLRLRALRIQAYRAQLPEAAGRDAGDPISLRNYPTLAKFPILDVDPEHVLKELVFANKFKSLPGVFANLGGRYVSEGVKAAIERLETVAPIQFIPASVRTQNGKLSAQYFLMHIKRLDDVIARRASAFEPRPVTNPNTGETFLFWNGPIRPKGQPLYEPGPERFVDLGKASGRHAILTDGLNQAWITPGIDRMHILNDVLFSQDLIDAAGLRSDPALDVFGLRCVERDVEKP